MIENNSAFLIYRNIYLIWMKHINSSLTYLVWGDVRQWLELELAFSLVLLLPSWQWLVQHCQI